MKRYANSKGIRIIGDIPLYVAMDSADVWTHSDLFELDERKKPIHVAGYRRIVFRRMDSAGVTHYIVGNE